MVIKLDRLKQDKREAIYYQNKLKEKGKDNLAYKMQKRIEVMNTHIEEISKLI